MREPKWTRGAYASAPALDRVQNTGVIGASAYVECWSGTVDELCSVLEQLSRNPMGSEDEAALACVSWTDGTSSAANELDSLRELLAPERLAEVLAVRISVRTDSGTKATLVARQKLPGLVLRVEGNESAAVLGASELAFRRMMVGYVDRMGGLRALFWMLSGIAPMILVSWAVQQSDASVPARLGLLTVAILSGFSLFAFSGPRLQVNQALVLLVRVPDNRMQQWRVLAKSVYANKRTKAIAGVAGALILGVIGNKLSDLIPFP
ncbi:hypothetical protein C5N14_07745 [Micromonospora sp. MW-13]|uniref:hypothetical protein n=1 Tax=Micromonospora sp. MW-13 TaxID=2094022 RepID=UPI000EDA0409|nr:hypothetical protein [Micromonospora sp. MW-13]RGC70301.1 hypothetical protein C5N14_07745 [Micromonospora sp. MW-13]